MRTGRAKKEATQRATSFGGSKTCSYALQRSGQTGRKSSPVA
jgi:hypothetical protein